MTYDCPDCMERIRKQLKDNNIDPDRKLGNLEDYLETIKKLQNLGIIKKTEHYIFSPYNEHILVDDD
jgi:hypothetical protein